MIELQTIPEKVIKAYKRDEITKEEAMRELCKHGFANFGNDDRAFDFYLTRY